MNELLTAAPRVIFHTHGKNLIVSFVLRSLLLDKSNPKFDIHIQHIYTDTKNDHVTPAVYYKNID